MPVNLFERLKVVNDAFFQMPELPCIKWSRGVIKKKYRKLTFGTYDIKRDQIRIHPILENEAVPAIVLNFVIYHELLHYQDRDALKERYKTPFFHKRSSHKVHNPHFHRREKAFPEKKEATKIMRELTLGTYWKNKY